MGAEFTVGTLEEMCDLMCDNVVPEKLCDTCIYRNNVEQLKPCIIYRDDCEYYEKERDMTREEAVSKYVMPAIKRTWNDKVCAEVESALRAKTGHWKRISIDLYVQHATAYYKCSECGEKVIGEHNYCQFCGARMESEDDK